MISLTGNNHTVEENILRDSSGNDAMRIFGNNHVIRNNQFIRIVAANTPGFTGRSTSNLNVALGSKSLLVSSGLRFSRYDQVTVFSESDPTKAMTGFVTAYTGSSLDVEVSKITGSGSAADWIIILGSDNSNTNHADIMQTFVNSYGEPTTNLLFEGNYAEDCTSQWGNLDHNPENNLSGNWILRNNLFVRSRITLNNYLPNINIYNNTFYDSGGYTTGLAGKYSTTRGAANNMRVFNNLFIRVSGISTGDGAYAFNASTTGSTADYNIITSLSDGAFNNLNAGANSINGGIAPSSIFENFTAGNFQLKIGSPALDSGTDLSSGLTGFTSSKNGSPRPQRSGWDIGAFELPADFAGTSPGIASHPTNATATTGTNATFTVIASGTAPLNYRWRKNGVDLSNGGNIAGATADTLTLTNVSSSDAATYTVVVNNAAGPAITSNGAILTVSALTFPPSIVNQPANNITTPAGNTVNFTVGASGTAPLTYQWKRNGVDLANGGNISGANTATLTLASVVIGDSATYSVVVNNAVGPAVTSGGATLTVTPVLFPPAIVTQPVDVTTLAGNPATFTVVATGTGPLTYQWKKNGINLSNVGNVSGATANTLTLASVSISDSATYTVSVNNDVGPAVTSNSAGLSVTALPVAPGIATQPSNAIVPPGSTAQFTVGATGTAPLTYQWKKGGVNLTDGGNISGATSATLAVSSVSAADVGNYSVVVNNAVGPAITSNSASLAMATVAPIITQHPVNQVVTSGATVSFLVAATGVPVPTTFQWRKNGANITDGGNVSGSSSNRLTLANVSVGDAASYSVVVENGTAPAATSSNATLTINTAPVITLQPDDQTVAAGSTVTFVSDATGSPTPTFRWQKDGVPLSDGGKISGASTSILVLTNVAEADVGNYLVVATNAGGTSISEDAFLGVQIPPIITVQPSSLTVVQGTSASFSVAAEGTPTPTIQWKKGGVPLTNGGNVVGSNLTTLTLLSTSAADAGEYTATLKNSLDEVTTLKAVLTVTAPPLVNQAPVFTTQPVSQNALVGQKITLSAHAAALPEATYQWKKNGIELIDGDHIGGAQTNTLILDGVAIADSGEYLVVAKNSISETVSATAVLSVFVNSLPKITSQPTNQTANLGNAVFFSAGVEGFPTPSFQWRKNGVNLANTGNIQGANSRTLTISPVALTDAADYSLVISNRLGSATSNAATLTVTTSPVIGGPSITNQPPPATVVNPGTILQLSVTVAGEPTPTLQWRKNGDNLTNTGIISGTTTSTLVLNGVTAADAGDYSVVASNTHGTVVSDNYKITVLTTSVANQTVTTGKDVALFASNASGAVRWQISSDAGATWSDLANDSTYSGVTSNTLHIENASSAMNSLLYRLIKDAGGPADVLFSAKLNVAPAFLPFPVGISADSSGLLHVADASSDIIATINVSSQVSTLAGTAGQTGTADGTGPAARFNDPTGLAASTGGSVAVADKANGTIRLISPAGVVTTLAGSTTLRGNVDGTGSAATFSSPAGIARDSAGNYYVADAMNHTIRKVTAAGVVTTLAGSAGIPGSSDGTGPAARFNNPSGIETDSAGNLFVADTTNNLIRKVTPAGVVTTLAGLAGVTGTSDGTGSFALFNQPGGVATDNTGNVYVADTGNSTIRRITSAGLVTTIAGLSGIAGHKDGSGIEAWFNQPRDLTVSAAGFLYVADTGNAAIRRIDTTGLVTTLILSEPPASNPTPTNPLPETPPLPTTPTLPTLPTSPTPPTSSGGGGGGAPSAEFLAALLTVWLTRRFTSRKA
ncbi:immunoglobulin domain-containing protein [Oleiharenicola lentus]|nr:immunoglobulin domain-containing protein [Oleiharenicola lentus]